MKYLRLIRYIDQDIPARLSVTPVTNAIRHWPGGTICVHMDTTMTLMVQKAIELCGAVVVDISAPRSVLKQEVWDLNANDEDPAARAGSG